MKAAIAVSLILFASLLTAKESAVPEIPYRSVPDFLKLPPDVYLGEVAGVAVNSRGHIFVFSRGNTTGAAYGAAAAQLLEFSADGKFVREIGHNLYAWSFAHSVKIDPMDNIWVADKGSDMVIKFDPEGRVAMVFGRKQEASDEGTGPLKHVKPPLPLVDGMFRQVTDMTWDAAGNTYISDGYVNSRVAKVDRNGNWVKSWGEPGDQPGQFNTPHSIAADAQGNIYVADRGNRRIQIFDGDGKFLRQITINVPVKSDARPAIGNNPTATTGTMSPGAPWTVCITPGPKQVLYTSDAFPGRIYKLTLDGKLLGVLGESGKQPKQFGWIHEIACPAENELYVAELLNWRVQKLILEPGKSNASGDMNPPFHAVNGGFVAMSVADLDASAKWYEEKLGLKTVKQATSPDKKSSVTILEGNGLSVELVRLADAVSLSKIAPELKGSHQVHGIFKSGIYIDDLDSAWTELKSRNATVAFEPFFDAAMQSRMFAIRDNNGNILQFFGR